MNYIKEAISSGKNVVIAGATGEGKTTDFETIKAFSPSRTITIDEIEVKKFADDCPVIIGNMNKPDVQPLIAELREAGISVMSEKDYNASLIEKT